MKLRIVITVYPNLGHTQRWPGCKTGEDAAQHLRSLLKAVLAMIGARADVEVSDVTKVKP